MTLVRAGDPYDMARIGLECPRLPFRPDSLEPLISREAVVAHHGQHQAYCRNTQRIVQDPGWADELAGLTLLEVVQFAAKHRDPGGPNDLFSQAGQAWNHAFLWLSLRQPDPRPYRLSVMSDDEFLDTALGSVAAKSGFDNFAHLQNEFVDRAAKTFGSQWAWLVFNGKELDITVADGAESPVMFATPGLVTPLLVVDCWEHAFYADFGFNRAAYAKACVERLLDWDRAEAIMALELCD